MDLKTFYGISDKKVDNNIIKAIVNFEPNHPIYKGHFPDNPVVPGIMQIEIINDILKSELKKTIQLEKVNTIKYLNIINPQEQNLLFEIKYQFSDKKYKVKCIIKKEELIFSKFSGIFSV